MAALGLLTLTALPVNSWSRSVNFKVYTFEGVKDEDMAPIREGIELFARLVREQCKILIEPQISQERRASPGEWGYDADWRDIQVDAKQKFSFRDYQAGVYELAKREKLPQLANQIDLFVRNGWENCATSFPVIQFYDDDARARAQNQKLNAMILPWMVNRVLLVSKSSAKKCEAYDRMVAHEIGHVFIQDNPPHYCPSPFDSERMSPCYGENLMAHSMLVGRSEPLDEVFATGTRIYDAQCRQIEKSLNSIWDPLP